MPRTAAECFRMADEAIHTAEQANDAGQRDVMLRIAHQWMKLAEHVADCERITAEVAKPPH